MSDIEYRILDHLAFLYGRSQAETLLGQIRSIIADSKTSAPGDERLKSTFADFDQRDAILITYGDQVTAPGKAPLETLGWFLDEYMQGLVSGVHILPFYPSSSDDGFSVTDYCRVDPALGTWEHIAAIGAHFRLMFDAVINHISRHSAWFQAFLRGEKPYSDYFISVDPAADLSQVVRPRALPLLTPVSTSAGIRHVWTTFSDDQVDLNYANPQVLLEVVRILLEYVSCGAEIIRLDAIAYLWKEIGTPCIHLPQTHRVVKLLRAVLDLAASQVTLISETNVPQQENLSYFGNSIPGLGRTDEAQMVYQFPLAPLILHTFLEGDSTRLTGWAGTLGALPPGTTLFNFTASHDGIGLNPAKGLLRPDEIQALVTSTWQHGGKASYHSDPDGGRSAYELNITWYDALNDPSCPDPELDIPRFLASQAIMLALAGVPGIYIHSLFGSRNCISCFDQTGRERSINREKFDLDALQQELSAPSSHKSRVLAGYRRLLQVRRQQSAFHPAARQRVLDLGPCLFAILRSAENGETLLCLTNVTSRPLQVEIGLSGLDLPDSTDWNDLLTGETFHALRTLRCALSPYQCRWLKLEKGSNGIPDSI